MNRLSPGVHADDVANSVAFGDVVSRTESVDRPVEREIDSNSVRWVLAATIAFWLVVYAAGRSFF